jgi:two-component system CheB/CheR fusion protein
MAINKEKSIRQAKAGAKNMLVTKPAATSKSKKNKAFPIVCIGGSAGSFQAMEAFFTHMPADAGIAFIIVMHIDPNHIGNIAALIQKYTPMPVINVEDGVRVESDTVYVIPPNRDMGIHNRKLLLLTPSKPNGYRLPIDYFLQSLAEDQWNKAVAIILSGMGSDGETGVRMIKEKLGMAMVQDPDTAQFNSMPKSAITTNLVDYVLSPEEMPIKLIQYLNHPAHTEEINEQVKIENRDAKAIQKILMLLRSHNGHDFSQYKINTITRRIDRRLAFHQLPDYNHYINYLRENPHEIDVLFNELLIGVTKFFRDQHAFDALKEKLFVLLRNKKPDDPIRVWVAGCSTGEEAYSIAMILMEYFGTLTAKKQPRAQIFATDLDMEAIEHARAGVYLSNIVADVAPDRIEKYFIKKEDHYVAKKELREMIVFAQHNLIKDAPFTRLDLLCCRNVMIYLNGDLQKKIIPIFHYALNPKGVMFMGPAETLGGFSDMFIPIDPKWKIFERKEGPGSTGRMLDFPFNVNRPPVLFKVEEASKPLKKKSLAEVFSKILLDNYTPASVLINEKGDILYINGKTGKFLELNPGEAVMNINQMVKEGLKYALSNAIHQARIQKTTVAVNDIKVKDDDLVRLVSLKVSFLMDNALQGLILVIFEDNGPVKKNERRSKDAKSPVHNVLAEELEKELIYTKQQLHTTIEQMETSLEELKSTNEELQSTNEELQSTNEESLTTKEEMQSLNEELMTINMQYQAKAEELTQLNNDMKNMLDSTEIGTIFLDINLIILRFTPQVKKLLNVIATDIGRSITDIVFNFEYPALESDIYEVVETLAIKETQIKTKTGEWYNLRIMPYRTLDNFINGAVLTFNKITGFKNMEHKFSALQAYIKNMLPLITSPALLLDGSMRIIQANQPCLKYFEVDPQQINGISLTVLAHEFWKTSKIDTLLKQYPTEEVSIAFTHKFPDIGNKQLLVTARPSINPETKEILMVLITLEEKTM